MDIMVEANDPRGQGIYSEYLGNIFLKKRRGRKGYRILREGQRVHAPAKQDEKKI
ncbi:MAG: hypothetical protein CM1200mP16_02820 [Nitrospina sp.]|nr:MAG: hypothetical protein CM1200mP16_02820 [Nitrospina sp.]